MTSSQTVMAAHFLRRSRRSSTSKVNFSVLTKRCMPILLSKLSENSALSGKCINVYVNFGVHRPLNLWDVQGVVTRQSVT